MGVNISVDEDVRPHEVLEDVWLGKTGPMVFTVPKTGILLSALVVDGDVNDAANEWLKARIRWLRAGLSAGDWAQIIDRLEDANDPLDMEHITDLYAALHEASTGRPTTSSNGSTPTPSGTGSEGEPKQNTTTSGDSAPDDLPI